FSHRDRRGRPRIEEQCMSLTIEAERSRRAAKTYAAAVAAAPRADRRTLLAFHGAPDRSPLDAIVEEAPLLDILSANVQRAAAAIADEPDPVRRRQLAREIDGAVWSLVLGYSERSYNFGVELGRCLVPAQARACR